MLKASRAARAPVCGAQKEVATFPPILVDLCKRTGSRLRSGLYWKKENKELIPMNPFIYVFGLLLTLDALREMAGAASVLGLW